MGLKKLATLLKKYDYKTEIDNDSISIETKKTFPLLMVILPIIFSIGFYFFYYKDNLSPKVPITLYYVTLFCSIIISCYGIYDFIGAIYNKLVIQKDLITFFGFDYKGKYETVYNRDIFVSIGVDVQENQTRDGIMYLGCIYIIINHLGEQQIPQLLTVISGKDKTQIVNDSNNIQILLSKILDTRIEVKNKEIVN